MYFSISSLLLLMAVARSSFMQDGRFLNAQHLHTQNQYMDTSVTFHLIGMNENIFIKQCNKVIGIF